MRIQDIGIGNRKYELVNILKQLVTVEKLKMQYLMLKNTPFFFVKAYT